MDTGEFKMDLTAVANITSHVAGLHSHTGALVKEMETVILDVLAFAQIGHAVASGNVKLHGNLMQVMGQLLKLFSQVNDNVKKAADGYNQMDKAVAHGFGSTDDGHPAPKALPPTISI